MSSFSDDEMSDYESSQGYTSDSGATYSGSESEDENKMQDENERDENKMQDEYDTESVVTFHTAREIPISEQELKEEILFNLKKDVYSKNSFINKQLSKMYSKISNSFILEKPKRGVNLQGEKILEYFCFIKENPKFALPTLLWIDTFHDFKDSRVSTKTHNLNKILNETCLELYNKIPFLKIKDKVSYLNTTIKGDYNISKLYQMSFFKFSRGNNDLEIRIDGFNKDVKYTILKDVTGLDTKLQKYLAKLLYDVSTILINMSDAFESDFLNAYMIFNFNFSETPQSQINFQPSFNPQTPISQRISFIRENMSYAPERTRISERQAKIKEQEQKREEQRKAEEQKKKEEKKKKETEEKRKEVYTDYKYIKLQENILSHLRDVSWSQIENTNVPYYAKDVDEGSSNFLRGGLVIIPSSLFDANSSNSSKDKNDFVNIPRTIIPVCNGYNFIYEFNEGKLTLKYAQPLVLNIGDEVQLKDDIDRYNISNITQINGEFIYTLSNNNQYKHEHFEEYILGKPSCENYEEPDEDEGEDSGKTTKAKKKFEGNSDVLPKGIISIKTTQGVKKYKVNWKGSDPTEETREYLTLPLLENTALYYAKVLTDNKSTFEEKKQAKDILIGMKLYEDLNSDPKRCISLFEENDFTFDNKYKGKKDSGKIGLSPKEITLKIITLLMEKNRVMENSQNRKKYYDFDEPIISCKILDFWVSLKRIGDFGQILQCKQLGIPLFTNDQMQILISIAACSNAVWTLDYSKVLWYNGNEDAIICNNNVLYKDICNVKRKNSDIYKPFINNQLLMGDINRQNILSVDVNRNLEIASRNKNSESNLMKQFNFINIDAQCNPN